VWAGKVGARKIDKILSFWPHCRKNFEAGKDVVGEVVNGLTTYHFSVWYKKHFLYIGMWKWERVLASSAKPPCFLLCPCK
jgi:hypothetical protein